MKPVIAIAASAVALAAGSAAAQVTPGQADVQTDSASVSYRDLDVTRSDGRATLERRVEMAIDRVCGDRPLAVEVRRQAQFSECRSQVAAGARQDLAALYSRQGVATAEQTIRLPKH